MPPLIRQCATVLALAACAAALGGCSGDSWAAAFGLIRDAPDEFTVTTRAPLAMPPSFTLPPPRPGATRPQEQSERARRSWRWCRRWLWAARPAAAAQASRRWSRRPARRCRAAIRTEVDQEAPTRPAVEGSWRQLMFWRKPPQPGIVVDPEKEAQRLRENAALGQSQETGDTPIVQPKQRAGWKGSSSDRAG